MLREVDLMPDGKYAFVVVVPIVRNRAELWFYTWSQVEHNADDGRMHPPESMVQVANRELLQLARYLLQAAGHDAAFQINVPDQDWHQVGNQSRPGVTNGSEKESSTKEESTRILD